MNHKLDTDTQVFFYEQEFYVLSNFAAFNLFWRNRMFHTSEAAYQYEKFSNYNRSDYFLGTENDLRDVVRESIAKSNSAHDAFTLAQKYKFLANPDWETIRVKKMKEILFTKIEQHPYVKKKLLETGNREIVEDSWRDDFWGWGPNKDGQNMLGKLWMEIRGKIVKQK